MSQINEFKEHLKSDNQLVKSIGDFKKKKIGHVEVEYGLDDEGNYVWHFSSFARAKPFPENWTLFKRIVQTYLGPQIPSDIEVDVYVSPQSWEIRVLSVLARGVGKKWNYDEDQLTSKIEQCCNHMTEEINRINPRRNRL